MANTFTLIEAQTLSSSATGITFSSIPGTYTDLQLILSLRDTNTGVANDNSINFNGSATSFTGKRLYGNGATASSDSAAPYAGSSTSTGATASVFANTQIYIPNYSGSSNKSFSINSVTENNAGGANTAYALFYGGLWSNTAAITSISVLAPSGYNFVQYSSAYLYGIKNS
jgi:hypothetical protein